MRARMRRRLCPDSHCLSNDKVEQLFASVDETGHTTHTIHANKDAYEIARFDPLDPAASPAALNERRINRRAVLVVLIAAVLIVGAQVGFSVIRRMYASSLADSATVETVSTALRLGVEWGDGFTQFPDNYVVQEADEGTGCIEVMVINTQSSDVLECFSSSQIQAAALSVNALLNPNINRVVYHVNVYVDNNGNIQAQSVLGLPSPEGELTGLFTFIWTKEITDAGITLSCTVRGMDEEMTNELRSQLASPSITLEAS